MEGEARGREEMTVEGSGAASAAPPYPSRPLRTARSRPRPRPGARGGLGLRRAWPARGGLAQPRAAWRVACGGLGRSLRAWSVWGSGEGSPAGSLCSRGGR